MLTEVTEMLLCSPTKSFRHEVQHRKAREQHIAALSLHSSTPIKLQCIGPFSVISGFDCFLRWISATVWWRLTSNLPVLGQCWWCQSKLLPGINYLQLIPRGKAIVLDFFSRVLCGIKLSSRRQSLHHSPSARKAQISSECVFKLQCAQTMPPSVPDSGETVTSYRRRTNALG